MSRRMEGVGCGWGRGKYGREGKEKGKGGVLGKSSYLTLYSYRRWHDILSLIVTLSYM